MRRLMVLKGRIDNALEKLERTRSDERIGEGTRNEVEKRIAELRHSKGQISYLIVRLQRRQEEK